ncbi:unnamed protein product [Meganyctiphanes norvegica]|uniref:Uncharacterized protein n=1 Tax=Meganyctiphanes norvegica TaxID=48144 RepID=A0AAV2RYZ6_MEGNR
MSHFTSYEIEQRHLLACKAILIKRQALLNSAKYIIQWPCRPGCAHMTQVPRIVLDSCLYVGELDKFYVQQPFLPDFGFRVIWHCQVCSIEQACGFPPIGTDVNAGI